MLGKADFMLKTSQVEEEIDRQLYDYDNIPFYQDLFCFNCGLPIENKRRRKFCSDHCKEKFHKRKSKRKSKKK